MSNQNANEVNATKGRKMFLMLALVFILPFTLAFTLHLLDIRPSGKSFGTLISPVVALDIPAFEDAKGQPFSAEQWNKVWNMVMVDAAGCQSACEQNVDKLNRVHRTLYKDIDRIQRVLILSGEADSARIKQLQEKFPRLVLLTATESMQQQFIENFNQAAPAGSVYLVDPLNNLMMHYPQDVNPKSLRGDVKKLLKTSWNG